MFFLICQEISQGNPFARGRPLSGGAPISGPGSRLPGKRKGREMALPPLGRPYTGCPNNSSKLRIQREASFCICSHWASE